MNLTRDRVQSLGWALVFTICLAMLAGLTLRVNAVKSQVALTERRILAVRREQLALETEFQTRSNQQQLAQLNEVEFGYTAPDATQYVAGHQQLAMLGRDSMPAPLAPVGAPATSARADVRLASAAVPASGPASVPAPVSAGAAAGGGTLAAAVAPLAGVKLANGPATHFLGRSERVSAPAAKAPATTVPAKPTRVASTAPAKDRPHDQGKPSARSALAKADLPARSASSRPSPAPAKPTSAKAPSARLAQANLTPTPAPAKAVAGKARIVAPAVADGRAKRGPTRVALGDRLPASAPRRAGRSAAPDAPTNLLPARFAAE